MKSVPSLSGCASCPYSQRLLRQQRGDLGAIQNQLGFTVRSLENTIENVQASESTIRDADMAHEVSQFTRAQILVQASTALLAQANAIPQNALTLLQ